MQIVLASDGSQGALVAARFVAALDWPAETSLLIVTAAEEEAEAILARTREALALFAGHIACQTLASGGTQAIAMGLLEATAASQAHLLVVGSYGRTGLERFLIGSVAEALVRHAEVPVLVVHPPVVPLHRVLLALDGSDLARDAATWALDHLPFSANCHLDLVRVAPSPLALLPAEPVLAPVALAQMEDRLVEEEKAAWTFVREQAQQFQASVQYGDWRFEGEACVGSPATELVHLARERKEDLIVIGARGRGQESLFSMGSVAERILHHAPCSVLVVGARHATQGNDASSGESRADSDGSQARIAPGKLVYHVPDM